MIRPAALLAAIAISLLAVSGAGGTSAQTPKPGGTIAVQGQAEPACLNPLVATCLISSPLVEVEKVLEPAFDVDARFTFRPRLVSSVTVSRRPPFTLTYHIRREARWSGGGAGDRSRLRLHARCGPGAGVLPPRRLA